MQKQRTLLNFESLEASSKKQLLCNPDTKTPGGGTGRDTRKREVHLLPLPLLMLHAIGTDVFGNGLQESL
jgi:hypothetical protein